MIQYVVHSCVDRLLEQHGYDRLHGYDSWTSRVSCVLDAMLVRDLCKYKASTNQVKAKRVQDNREKNFH